MVVQTHTYKALGLQSESQQMSTLCSLHTLLRLQLGRITTSFPAQKSRRVSIKPSRKFSTKYIHFIQVSRDEMHMPCYALFEDNLHIYPLKTNMRNDIMQFQLLNIYQFLFEGR